MTTHWIDGKQLAQSVRESLKKRVATLSQKPVLTVLLVGSDAASATYVRLKERACEEVGIRCRIERFDADVTQQQLEAVIDACNADPEVSGVILQLPLPAHLNPTPLTQRIDPQKDVDGFHPENIRALQEHRWSLVSPVALAVMKLLENIPITEGCQATLVMSERFAQPLISLFLERALPTPRVVDKSNQELQRIVASSDLTVVGIGQPHRLTTNWLKPGAVVIDVGTTWKDGVLCGDLHPEAAETAPLSHASPVPGGVGPLTVAYLLLNTLKAALYTANTPPSVS